MRALVCHTLTGPQDLKLETQWPEPTAGPGEVLVEVKAAALNFPDVLMTRGLYQERPPLPFVPGLELAGVVSAVGEAFNNVAVHAYANHSGNVDFEISADDRALTIRMSDTGLGFEPEAVPKPDLPSLPERTMGLFIIRSFMDEVVYVPGSPNVGPNTLTMIRRFFR